MVSSKDSREVTLVDSGNVKLNQVKQFKNFGATLMNREGLEKAIREGLNAAWNKWKEVSG